MEPHEGIGGFTTPTIAQAEILWKSMMQGRFRALQQSSFIADAYLSGDEPSVFCWLHGDAPFPRSLDLLMSDALRNDALANNEALGSQALSWPLTAGIYDMRSMVLALVADRERKTLDEALPKPAKSNLRIYL